MRNSLFLYVTCFALLAGCDRLKLSDNVQLQIAMPAKLMNTNQFKISSNSVSAASVSSANLVHMVINITGPSISTPIYYQWDAHDGNSSSASPTIPDSVALDVPRGDNRLVQVLAAYQVGQSLVFYYGDVTKSLSASQENVDVPIANLGTGSSSLSGRISGRYLTSANNGPTGEVYIKLSPGANKPPVIIQKGVIVNGWFSLFGLSDVNFTYEVQPGPAQSAAEVLFGGPVSLSSSIFDPNENSGAEWNRRVRMALPVHIRRENNSGGTFSYNPEEGGYFAWGYWGNTMAKADSSWSTRQVCKDSLNSVSMSNLFKYTSVSANWSSAPALTVSNYINIGLTLPTADQLLNQDDTTSLSYAAFLGGQDGSCPGTSSLYSSWLRVALPYVDGQGNDHIAGFDPPFKFSSNNNVFSVTTSGSTPVVAADLLPGSETTFSEFRIYKKVGVSSDYHLNSPDCTTLSSQGYTFAGSGAASAAGHVAITTNITAAERAQQVAGVMCFVLGGQMASEGMSIDQHYFSSSGGSGTTSLGFLAPSTSSTIYNGSCVALSISSLKPDGSLGFLDTSLQYTLSSSNGSDQFYSDLSCTNALSNPFSISTNGGPFFVGYRSNSSGASSGHSLTLNYSGSNSGTSQINFSVADLPASTPDLIHIGGVPSTMVAFQCYPGFAETVLTGTDIGLPFTSGPASIYLSATGSISFFSDANCTQSLSQLVLGQGGGSLPQLASPFYMSYRSLTAAAATVSATNGSGWSGSFDSTALSSSQIQTPSAPSQLRLSFPTTMTSGACIYVNVDLLDSNGHLTAGTSGTNAVDFSLNSGSGTFYGSSGCGSGDILNPAQKYISGDGITTSTGIYFKPSFTGSGSMTVSTTIGGVSMSQTMGFTSLQEVASRFLLVLPGQNWSSGMNIDTATMGAPYMMTDGSQKDIAATIYAIKSDNTIDTTYNSTGNLASNMSSYFDVNPTPMAAPQIINGQASVTIRFYTSATATTGQNFYSSNFVAPMFNGLAFANDPLSMSFLPNMPASTFFYSAYNGGTAMSNAACTPIFLQSVRQDIFSSVSYYPSSSYYTNISMTSNSNTGGTNLYLYSDANCTTALTPSDVIIAAAGNSAGLIYAQPSSSSGSYNLNLTLSTGSVVLNGSANASAPGSLSSYSIMGPPSFFTNTCQALALVGVDSSGNSVASSGDTVNLTSSTGGIFYSDPTCGSNITSIALSSGDRAKIFYYKNPQMTTGASTLSDFINATGGSASGSGTFSLLLYR